MYAATFNLPVAMRFLWKEYRSLRALWFAVLVLGLFIQWFVGRVLPRGIDWVTIYFTIAFASAVLYTVGAAATTFSLEHEDETYDFLRGLPTSWMPIFLGKLAYVAGSAIALAAMLSIAGWIAAGYNTPGRADTPRVVGIFGVAVLEALAWGTLFSLVVKRPLLAAILTLVVGTVTVQIAASVNSQHNAALSDPNSYINAVPLRLAIAFTVLLAAIVRARDWFSPGRARFSGRSSTYTIDPAHDQTNRLGRLRTQLAARFHANSHRSALFRLVWQSWRESWKFFLAPLPIAAMLSAGISLLVAATSTFSPVKISHPHSLYFFTVMELGAAFVLLPGLYGALVFSADQRNRRYRFLAEHAAQPRIVWLARHATWGGALVLVLAGLLIVFALPTLRAMADALHDMVYDPNLRRDEQIPVALSYLGSGASYALFGMFFAYAVGQFFSMLLRSEILAAFFACLASLVVALWAALMFGWELSAAWFVLLPATGFLLATWLRAPAWIVEKNTWRYWLAPAAAILFPAAIAVSMIPEARLAQISRGERHRANETLAPLPKTYDAGDTEAARETASMYLDAATPYSAPFGQIEGSEKEHRERAIAQFVTATKRPSCRFDFQITGPTDAYSWIWSRNPKDANRFSYSYRPALGANYAKLLNFMVDLADNSFGTNALDRFAQLLRASGHVREAQPTAIYIDQLQFERYVLKRLREWSGGHDVTTDELRKAIKLVETYSKSMPGVAESLFADRNAVWQALVGNEPPVVLEPSSADAAAYAAYLLNRLPWELERSTREVDVLTADAIRETNDLRHFLAFDGGSKWPINHQQLRAMMLRVIENPRWREEWTALHPAEPLGAREFRARVHLRELELALTNAELDRRATLLQLALVLYRLENDRYPATLAELDPKFLAAEPLDPYGGKPFSYLAEGLDLPLDGTERSEPYFGKSIRVPPDTPFFWSVGPSNVGYPAREERKWTVANPEEINAPIERSESIYRISRGDAWPNNAFSLYQLP